MGFFGAIISKKKRYKINIPDGHGLQLCGAALGNPCQSVPEGFTALNAVTKSGRFVLCNLSQGLPQSTLNQNFVFKDSPVDLMVEGEGTIHLTGFWDVVQAESESDEEINEEAMSDEGLLQSDEDEEEPEKVAVATPGKKRKLSVPEDTNQENDKDSSGPNEDLVANEKSETPKTEIGDQSANKKMKKKKKKKKTGDADGPETKTDGLKVPETKIKPRNIQGMTIKDVILGTGKSASKGQKVGVLYEVSSPSGEVYDKNWNSRKPLNFRIGIGEVIEGVEKGVQGMRVNGERILNIPPELGYGKKGAGPIKPNSQLVFHIKLVSVG